MVAHHLSLSSTVRAPATAHGRGVLETTTAWVEDLLDAVDLEPGERVLDLTDGTVVVARAVAGRVRPGGTASVVDAKTLVGYSARLPYPDASFDSVVSLHTLEAIADRGRVLAELRRVLCPGGRLALAVWGPLEGNPAFAALAGSLHRRAGGVAAAAVHWLFSLSQPADLHALLTAASFDRTCVHRTSRTVTASSAEQLLRSLARTFPVGAATEGLPWEAREGLVADLEDDLGPWMGDRGIPFTTDVHTALVRGVSAGDDLDAGRAEAEATRPGAAGRPRAPRSRRPGA